MNVNTNYTQPGLSNVAAHSKSNVLKRRSTGPEQPNSTAGDLKTLDSTETQQTGSPVPVDPTLSDQEKDFFQQLFPSSAADIRAYAPYQRNGRQQPSQIGTLIDGKG